MDIPFNLTIADITNAYTTQLGGTNAFDRRTPPATRDVTPVPGVAANNGVDHFNVLINGQEIPVVFEECYATAPILIFNTLNSCIGIISPDGPTNIRGVHMPPYLSNNAAVQDDKVATGVLDNARKWPGAASFGGSQDYYESMFKTNAAGELIAATSGTTAANPSKLFPVSVPGDANDRCWIVYRDTRTNAIEAVAM